MRARSHFRETLWFKAGEEPPPSETDGAIQLPVEDRYLDDGSVTPADSLRFGVHGGVALDDTVRAAGVIAPGVDVTVLARELHGRARTALVSIVVGATMIVASVIAFTAM